MRQRHEFSSSTDRSPYPCYLNISTNHRLQRADYLGVISHHPFRMQVNLLDLRPEVSSRLAQLLLYASLVLILARPGLGRCHCEGCTRGRRLKGVMARAASEVAPQVGAGAEDGSTLRSRTLCRSGRGTDAGSHTAGAGAGSTLPVGCSPLGCTPPRVGTSGRAAAGIHRS